MLVDELVRKLGKTHAELAPLEPVLSGLIARGRAAYPDLEVSDAAFISHVAEHLDPTGAVHEALVSLQAEALFLACACTLGRSAAVVAFEREHFHQVRAAHAQLRLEPTRAEELTQRLRERLFVGSLGGRPAVSAYSGRGDLGRWLKAVALRAAIDTLRVPNREVASDEALATLAFQGDDPEIEHLKIRYAGEFAAALRRAIGSLPPETRTELKLYYLDGLRLDELASLFHVAPSTISRRLTAARRELLDQTRAALREQLKIDDSELESILTLIASRMDVARSAFER